MFLRVVPLFLELKTIFGEAIVPSFPHPRDGNPVRKSGQAGPFVLYAPPKGGDAGHMLASNPWKCMELHLAREKRTAADTCSFLRQAYDFFKGAEHAAPTPKAVLMYYAFLNLAKAIILHKDSTKDLERALHGVAEAVNNVRQRFTVTSQGVTPQPARKNRLAILNELVATLGHQRLPVTRTYEVCDLLAQIPAIHRPFAHTRGIAERLYHIKEAGFYHDHTTRTVWSLVFVRRSKFTTGQARNRLTARNYFSLELVESDEAHRDFYAFQSEPVHYGLSPFESLHEVCRQLRKAGVVSILTPAGYRYYFSDFEPRIRVQPIIAAYMAIFYFGSVARYRPLDFEKMRTGKFAWVIEEMLATQGEQFVYMIASELLNREVARPWAVQGGTLG